jgi:hypothetical protein
MSDRTALLIGRAAALTLDERRELSRAMRAGGMAICDIARRLEVSRSSVRDYLSPPRSRSGRCPCGEATSRQGRRCRGCAARARTRWTPDTALASLVRWARDNDALPRARDVRADPSLPSVDTLIRLIGPWRQVRSEVAAQLTVLACEQPPALGSAPCRFERVGGSSDPSAPTEARR